MVAEKLAGHPGGVEREKSSKNVLTADLLKRLSKLRLEYNDNSNQRHGKEIPGDPEYRRHVKESCDEYEDQNDQNALH